MNMKSLFSIVSSGGDQGLKNELKEYKDQNEALKRENDILKKFYFEAQEKNSDRMFNKLLSNAKSAFFDTNTSNDSLSQFKSFLLDNNLFFYSFDDDEVSCINELILSDFDWNENKKLFLLKQKLLERNYKLLMMNIEDNDKLKDLENRLVEKSIVKIKDKEDIKPLINKPENKDVINEYIKLSEVPKSQLSQGSNQINEGPTINETQKIKEESKEELKQNEKPKQFVKKEKKAKTEQNDLLFEYLKDDLKDNDILNLISQQKDSSVQKTDSSNKITNFLKTDEKTDNKKFLWDDEEDFN